MRIGAVASAAAVSAHTLRFYERRGLIARPQRDASGYRVYTRDVLERLAFIHDAKALGFSLRETGELLKLGARSAAECGPVSRRAEAKLAALHTELERLQHLRRSLIALIHRCDGHCGCPTCRRCAGSAARRRERRSKTIAS